MFTIFWRDMHLLGKSLRFYTLFMLFYLLLAILGLYELSFILSTSTLIMMMLPLSAFTVQVDCTSSQHLDVVNARYLFSLLVAFLMLCINMTISTVYSIATQDTTIVTALFVVSMSSLILVSLLLPLAFCLPIQKIRPILYGTTFLAISGISQISHFSFSSEYILLYSLILSPSGFILSYFLSRSLVSKGLWCYNGKKET